MKAKTRKNIITFLIVIVIAIVVILGLKDYRENRKKTSILSSSYNGYTVRVYMIGTPVFPYGETSCRIDLLKNGKRVNQQSLSLLNDGAVVTEDNFVVEWNEEYVRVIAYASEMDEIEVTLAL